MNSPPGDGHPEPWEDDVSNAAGGRLQVSREQAMALGRKTVQILEAGYYVTAPPAPVTESTELTDRSESSVLSVLSSGLRSPSECPRPPTAISGRGRRCHSSSYYAGIPHQWRVQKIGRFGRFGRELTSQWSATPAGGSLSRRRAE
jgi:hypothetical protein